MITENHLKDLGFIKSYGDGFYYFTLDITPDFFLISNSNDEYKDKGIYVYVGGSDELEIDNIEELSKLIKIIKNAKRTYPQNVSVRDIK